MNKRQAKKKYYKPKPYYIFSGMPKRSGSLVEKMFNDLSDDNQWIVLNFPPPYSPDFYNCVTIKTHHNEHVQIDCRIGLWSVSGSNRDAVLPEAFNYWHQYYSDGEYAEHLERVLIDNWQKIGKENGWQPTGTRDFYNLD